MISSITNKSLFNQLYAASALTSTNVQTTSNNTDVNTISLTTDDSADEESSIISDDAGITVNNQGSSNDLSMELTTADTSSNITTKSTSSGKKQTKEQIQQQIDEVKKKQKGYNEKIELYKQECEKLQREVEQAQEESEELEEQNQLTAKTVADNVMNEYKNGKIDKSDLESVMQEKVKSVVDETQIETCQNTIQNGQAKIAQYSVEIATLTTASTEADEELAELYEKLEEADEAAATSSTTSTDDSSDDDADSDDTDSDDTTEPQGFQVSNADGSTTQYDFFVDRDGNNGLTNATEFLGAVTDMQGEDGWDEMKAYDTNNDGKITYEELKKGSNNKTNGGELMVMVTHINEDGTKTQEALSLEEDFGKNSDLEIDTQKNTAIDSEAVPEGFYKKKYNNELLGNYNVNYNGQNITGYQTNDDNNYLNDYYTFTSGSAKSNTSRNLSSNYAGSFNNYNSFGDRDVTQKSYVSGTNNLESVLSDLYKNVQNIGKNTINNNSAESNTLEKTNTNNNSQNGTNEKDKKREK